MNNKRLYRSSRNSMVGGVAGGLAEYFNLDPTLVRLLWIVAAIVTAAVPVLMVYVVLWAVMPVGVEV